MDFVCIPIIVLICYMVGEIYKVLFKNKQEAYKLIPILVAIFGGILGVLIFYTNPTSILNVDNLWDALLIGIISGFSATGTNQVIKQIFNIKNSKVGK